MKHLEENSPHKQLEYGQIGTQDLKRLLRKLREIRHST